MNWLWRGATAAAVLPVVAYGSFIISIANADDPLVDPTAAKDRMAAQRATVIERQVARSPAMLAGFSELWSAAAAKVSRPPLPPLRRLRLTPHPTARTKPGAAFWRPTVDQIPAYDLRQVRNGALPVPAIFVERLPTKLAGLERPQARKDAFVRVMLPLILDANEKLLAERRRYAEIFRRWQAGDHPTEAEFDALAMAMSKYRLDSAKVVSAAALLQRIDIIPPSLALAQAAQETGWGRSRFAMIGNAVYGQRTWTPGTGLVPRKRGNGKRYEIKTFATLGQSVESYFRNLNSHQAYAGFRRARANIRQQYAGINGYRLATALSGYSERGAKYVRSIRRLIAINNLAQFDPVRLARVDTAAARRELHLLGVYSRGM